MSQVEAQQLINNEARKLFDQAPLDADMAVCISTVTKELHKAGRIVLSRAGGWVLPINYVEPPKDAQDTRHTEAEVQLVEENRLYIQAVGNRGISIQDRKTATQVVCMHARSQYQNRVVALRHLINILIAENLL